MYFCLSVYCFAFSKIRWFVLAPSMCIYRHNCSKNFACSFFPREERIRLQDYSSCLLCSHVCSVMSNTAHCNSSMSTCNNSCGLKDKYPSCKLSTFCFVPFHQKEVFCLYFACSHWVDIEWYCKILSSKTMSYCNTMSCVAFLLVHV